MNDRIIAAHMPLGAHLERCPQCICSRSASLLAMEGQKLPRQRSLFPARSALSGRDSLQPRATVTLCAYVSGWSAPSLSTQSASTLQPYAARVEQLQPCLRPCTARDLKNPLSRYRGLRLSRRLHRRLFRAARLAPALRPLLLALHPTLPT